MVQAANEQEQEEAARAAEAFLKEELPEAIFGAPKAGPGMWASCLRLMHPTQVRGRGCLIHRSHSCNHRDGLWTWFSLIRTRQHSGWQCCMYFWREVGGEGPLSFTWLLPVLQCVSLLPGVTWSGTSSWELQGTLPCLPEPALGAHSSSSG